MRNHRDLSNLQHQHQYVCRNAYHPKSMAIHEQNQKVTSMQINLGATSTAMRIKNQHAETCHYRKTLVCLWIWQANTLNMTKEVASDEATTVSSIVIFCQQWFLYC